MLLIGFAGIGFGAYRRRVTAAQFAFTLTPEAIHGTEL
jgi:hypothetical protein